MVHTHLVALDMAALADEAMHMRQYKHRLGVVYPMQDNPGESTILSWRAIPGREISGACGCRARNPARHPPWRIRG